MKKKIEIGKTYPLEEGFLVQILDTYDEGKTFRVCRGESFTVSREELKDGK